MRRALNTFSLFTKPRPIQFWLSSLVVACILPAAATIAFVVAQSYLHERADLERDTVEQARALIQVVDRDLANAQTALSVLATSPYLAAGDLARFHRQAREVLATQSGNGIVLADASGQQIMSTVVPYGEPLPRTGLMGLLKRLVETGEPAISDFYIGTTSKKPQVAVGVPVVLEGKSVYALTMGFLPSRFNDILQRQSLPPDWIVSLFDRHGTIIARTHAADQFVGQKGAPALVRQMAEATEGFVETRTLEGTPVLAAFSRSPISGWALAIGVPTASLTADLRHSLWLTAGSAGFLLLLGILLAHLVSGHIARSIRSLAAPALALATGHRPSAPESDIAEVQRVMQSLTSASELLDERERQRKAAERAEREMEVKKLAAEQASRAKSDFLALMSHELRTPMNAVLGFAQLLKNERFGHLSAKQTEFAEHILSSGDHLLKLINDMLDLGKAESGRVTVSIEETDLVSLMKSVVATLRQLSEKAAIALDPGDFGVGLPRVGADRMRLMQILINLGSNAIKYNRPGGFVRFSYERGSGDKVRIVLEDSGFGIAQERQPELFQPFNRLGAEQKGIEGTGIGLALSRRLIELMGGTIGFASTLGRGSRFWIEIPVHTNSRDRSSVVASGVEAA